MVNMPIAGPTTTGKPAPMSRTRKVNEFMHAAIMQWFYQYYAKPRLLALAHPLVLRMGARFLVVPISDIAKLSANKILWRPGKSVPGGLVGGFSAACGSSPLYLQYQHDSSPHNKVDCHRLKNILHPGSTLE